MSKELEALERLFKCNDDDYTMGYQHHDYKLLQEALQRLEAIEKLQEEIGMDLLLALKCLLSDKIYFISARTNRIEYKSPTARSLKYKSMNFAFDNTTVEFKDYGKTWALTKEELKKDESE